MARHDAAGGEPITIEMDARGIARAGLEAAGYAKYGEPLLAEMTKRFEAWKGPATEFDKQRRRGEFAPDGVVPFGIFDEMRHVAYSIGAAMLATEIRADVRCKLLDVGDVARELWSALAGPQSELYLRVALIAQRASLAAPGPDQGGRPRDTVLRMQITGAELLRAEIGCTFRDAARLIVGEANLELIATMEKKRLPKPVPAVPHETD